MREYQSNSHRSRESQAEEPAQEKRVVEKVVSGQVTTRENKGRKFRDVFISEDAANVKSYIVMDVLVPAIKNAISAVVKDSIDMIFGTSSSSGRAKTVGSRVSYRNYYDDPRDSRRDYDNYSSRFDYDDIVYTTRGDAEAVRRMMIDTIRKYGIVTVADMYDMSGEVPPHTAFKYGWMNMRSIETIEPRRVRDGYILALPKASPID